MGKDDSGRGSARRDFLGTATVGSVVAMGGIAASRSAMAAIDQMPLDPAFYGASKLITGAPEITGTVGQQVISVVRIPKDFLVGQSLIRVHCTIRAESAQQGLIFLVQHGPAGALSSAYAHVVSLGGLGGPTGPHLIHVKGEISMNSPNSQLSYGYNSYGGGYGFLPVANGSWQDQKDYQSNDMDLWFSTTLLQASDKVRLLSGIVELFKDYPPQSRTAAESRP